MHSLTIPTRFQGPTAMGQGGWTAGQLNGLVGRNLTVRFRTPIPLDRAMTIREHDDGWRCTDGDTLVLEAEPRGAGALPTTDVVSIDDASAARLACPITPDVHPLPDCFSCGTRHDSMGVLPGPLPDGIRLATDWTVPDWVTELPHAADCVVWASLDCTMGFFAGMVPELTAVITGELEVAVDRTPVPGEKIALVSWDAGDTPGWSGRTRRVAGQAFAADGTTVATAISTWVRLA